MGFYRPWDEERAAICRVSKGLGIAPSPQLPIYLPPLIILIQLNQQRPQSLADLLWNISFCLPSAGSQQQARFLPVCCTDFFSNPSLIMRHEVKIPLRFQVR
jgi:hypothetical protein